LLTLSLQSLAALGALVFALLIAAVYRALPAHDPHRSGWYAVAVVYGIYGASAVTTGMLAAGAFAAGPGSAAWNGFLRIAPAGNLGRILLTYVLTAALFSLLWRRSFGDNHRRALWIACAAAVVAGGALGVAQGPTGPAHYATVATMQSVGLAAFSLTLLLVLRADALEATLWLALAAQCFSWALDTPLMAILASETRLGMPPAWVAMAVRVVFVGTSITLVAHRLVELRRGAAPRTLMVPARTYTA
jgi:hypothetical protein